MKNNKAIITCDIINSKKYSSENRKKINLLLKEAIYWNLKDLTFKEIAEKINITFQGAEKRIYNSNFLLFKEGMKYIGSLIK